MFKGLINTGGDPFEEIRDRCFNCESPIVSQEETWVSDETPHWAAKYYCGTVIESSGEVEVTYLCQKIKNSNGETRTINQLLKGITMTNKIEFLKAYRSHITAARESIKELEIDKANYQDARFLTRLLHEYDELASQIVWADNLIKLESDSEK